MIGRILGRSPLLVGRLACLVTVVTLLGMLSAPPAAANSAASWAAPRTVYIAETGQAIDGLFLDLWRNGGGVATFGNPVTPEIVEPAGTIVQYYEYARFEYWPKGDANGNAIALGDLGRELGPPLRCGWWRRRLSPPG